MLSARGNLTACSVPFSGAEDPIHDDIHDNWKRNEQGQHENPNEDTRAYCPLIEWLKGRVVRSKCIDCCVCHGNLSITDTRSLSSDRAGVNHLYSDERISSLGTGRSRGIPLWSGGNVPSRVTLPLSLTGFAANLWPIMVLRAIMLPLNIRRLEALDSPKSGSAWDR